MIILTFLPKDPLLIPTREIEDIISSFTQRLRSWSVYKYYVTNMECSSSIMINKRFSLVLNGITTKDTQSMYFFVRSVRGIYKALDPQDRFYACEAIDRPKIDDKIFDRLQGIPGKTRNARLLEEAKFSDEKIPERFLCPISFQIMDIPVFFPDRPQEKFENAFIRNAIMSDCECRHPFTRVNVDCSTLKIDTNLQSEIEYFVGRETGNYARLRVDVSIKTLRNSSEVNKDKIVREDLLSLARVVGTAPPQRTPLIEVSEIKPSQQNPAMLQYSISLAKFWVEHDLPQKGYEEIKKEFQPLGFDLDKLVHRW